MIFLKIVVPLLALLMFGFTWLYYFGDSIARWWRERGPRQQIAREAAQEREAELARLRDELAAKYLATPPPPPSVPPLGQL